ncbi:MAG: DNA polymerase III subunit gamma/tau [Thiotrichaceae bacterium]|nr:DNA polymerase III subunit gamma/tau [Thiotrichaceae bacterium]
MAYQVLARKWRPRNFPEMVGQAHVLRALTNALDNNRLHHAYLFTGTRGVGKTTIARILAKSLNCETGISAYPCGQCKTCLEIDEGRFVDMIEVDAASRTKVEDTRDLLENVQYAPTRGRYKVYLIDEVHMLSTHSFNALLKTLEEPPPHVKFLLATTDPQKLPPTILSRCLQFSLKRLPVDQITQHLGKIMQAEEIAHDLPSLQLIAHAADGSLRDALSLLDQAIAYGAGALTQADVGNMLGTLDQHLVLELLQALAAQNAPELLQRVAQLAERNPDFNSVLGDLLSSLQQIALLQFVPNSLDPNLGESEQLQALAQSLSPEDVQLFYQIALHGRRDLPLAPDPRGGFEMVLLRMLAFRPAAGLIQTAAPTVQTPAPNHAPQQQIAQSAPPPVVAPALPSVTSDSDWASIVRSLPIGGVVLQLALNCVLKQRDATVWHLALNSNHKVFFSKDREKSLEKALQQVLGQMITLQIQVENIVAETPAIQQQRAQQAEQNALESEVLRDPFVAQMKENCDARITIHPNPDTPPE